MTVEIRLPQLSMGMSDAEVIEWLVSEGDEVVEGTDLVEIEAEKAQIAVPSPRAGRIASIHAQPGDTVEVGGVLCSLEPA